MTATTASSPKSSNAARQRAYRARAVSKGLIERTVFLPRHVRESIVLIARARGDTFNGTLLNILETGIGVLAEDAPSFPWHRRRAAD